jgi:Tfp pilus assembly protein PilF
VQLARRIGGANICRIHEFFVVPTTPPALPWAFLTMEYLDGVTLADRINQGGPIPWRDAQSILVDVCCGLTTMHTAGIVHRDLKSRNIMLVEQGGRRRAVLMDFGLAREYSAPVATTETALTMPGAVVGTPEYMAPEQFEGKEVSPATDIYAAGVILYEIVTGKHPFAASSPLGAAMLRAKLPQPASALQHGVPHRWDHVIRKCLEYDAAQRYQSAEELAQALKSSLLGPHSPAVHRPWVTRIAVVGIFPALIIGIIARWQSSRQYYRPSTEAQHLYEEGLGALREGSYLKATLKLENAVQRDKKFAMAHARLAEAWSNLDFDGSAQEEMLIATSGESHLPKLDRLYVDAIRATLTRDFSGALKNYLKISNELPDSDKSAGYVDLGMAYERAGDTAHALQNFSKSLEMDHDNPAPLMQKAILETRLNRVQDANRDFGLAESLFRSGMNAEGQAELDFRRAYLANEMEASAEANSYLEKALSEAQHLPQPSIQLEIRALTQLSSVAYSSGEYTTSVKDATRAIELARDNQLMSWAADGLARLATAELKQGQYDNAQNHLNEAFTILNHTRQDRVLALANMTLASLRNEQGRGSTFLEPAQSALAYYRSHGFVTEAAQAALLIGRAERNQEHWPIALQAASDLIALANQYHRNDLLVQSEELEGSIYLEQEDYPRARDHYCDAFSRAQSESLRSYEAMFCADTLWRLGEFDAAAAKLKLAPHSNTHAGSIEVQSLLAQMKYAAARDKADLLLRRLPQLEFDSKQELTLDRAIALAGLGKMTEARQDIKSLLDTSGQPADEKGQPLGADDLAAFNLPAADVYLAIGDAKAALDSAKNAEGYSESKHLLDSAFRSAMLAAQAAKNIHDLNDEQAFKNKVVQLQSQLRSAWPSPEFHSYTFRPDIQSRYGRVAP